MKPENKQRFSIRKYAIGAASVLIGSAFHVQAVAADGVVPTTTENQPTIQAAGESSPQASEEKLETSPPPEAVAPAAPVTPVTKHWSTKSWSYSRTYCEKLLQPKKLQQNQK